MTSPLTIPLMQNNILREDINHLIGFLNGDDPILTQSSNVTAFEKEWSDWLGVKHSVFVNSGSSANLLTISALKHIYGSGEIIVPTLTWVSDIASVLHCGFKPVFVDIDKQSLGMKIEEVIRKITRETKAVFLTHILGYNALKNELLEILSEKNILLIEDVCESHGAEFKGKKLGSYGFASNFSFYYAHHMSTIEGGMVCTNDDLFYETVRMLRSHGMVRELSNNDLKSKYKSENNDLNPDFIFSYPAYNMRSSEINAVIGRNQLKRLDENNLKRRENLELFLSRLDSQKYFTDFNTEGSCNYAFTLLLREADERLRDRLETKLREESVEFRRGMSGGGNQLRQPYLKKLFGNHYEDFPNVNHVHFFGYYIGNYPDLTKDKIIRLCDILNEL